MTQLFGGDDNATPAPTAAAPQHTDNCNCTLFNGPLGERCDCGAAPAGEPQLKSDVLAWMRQRRIGVMDADDVVAFMTERL